MNEFFLNVSFLLLVIVWLIRGSSGGVVGV
jgi:hypothetical protein